RTRGSGGRVLRRTRWPAKQYNGGESPGQCARRSPPMGRRETPVYITRFLAVVFLATSGLLPGKVLAGDQPGAPPTGRLTVAEFEKLHKELQPPRDELWRSIPWQVSLLEGRELAARTRKPIFVWVASGEPLGCG